MAARKIPGYGLRPNPGYHTAYNPVHTALAKPGRVTFRALCGPNALRCSRIPSHNTSTVMLRLV